MQKVNRTISWKTVIGKVSAIIVGTVFLLAAFSKIGDLSGFQKALANYGFIPLAVRSMLLLFIPGIELAIGCCMVIGFYQMEAGMISALLLFGFMMLGIYDNALAAKQHACGCFKLQLPLWFEINGWGLVIRNMLLLVASIFATVWVKLKGDGAIPAVTHKNLV